MSAWIGTSGYSYEHWRGVLYPQNLPREKWLEHYALVFPAVELNVTFYRLPAASTFTAWRRAAPAYFRFVLKGSKLITHFKRLEDVTEALQTFFEPAGKLGIGLAAVLWQLPPRFPANPKRLDAFLASAAAAWARRSRRARPLRQAVEVRDRSWLSDDVYDVLRRHDAALVTADAPFRLLADPMQPADEDPGTVIRVPAVSSWVYMRRHGPGGGHRGSYTDSHLGRDARAIAAWAKDRDVFVFFNNDQGGHAPRNAAALSRMVGRS
jgi:uncharacterized protein YecE (DUF72 family)